MELKQHKWGLAVDQLNNWNCSQNSQSQKLSIGVPIEASAEAKMGFGTISSSFQKKCKSSLGKSVVEDMMNELGSFLGGKELGACNQGSGGWISPKNLHADKENVGYFSTYSGMNLPSGHIQNNLLTSVPRGRNKKTEQRKEPALVATSKMDASDKGVDGRRGRIIADENPVEDFKFTAGQTTLVDQKPSHEKVNAAVCGGSEALRLKLLETLGTAPVQKDESANVPLEDSISLAGQILENEKQNQEKVKAATCGGKEAVGQKLSDTLEIAHPQNDQTTDVSVGKNNTTNCKQSLQRNKGMKSGNSKLCAIESDYEYPYRSGRTPLTRSITQKRSSTTQLPKLRDKAPGNLLSSNDKVGCQGESSAFVKSAVPSGKNYFSNKMENILPAAEKTVSSNNKRNLPVTPANVCSTTPVNAVSPDNYTPKLVMQSDVETKSPVGLILEKTALSKSFIVNGRSKSNEFHSRASYGGMFTELLSESVKVKQDLKVPLQCLGDLSTPMEDKNEHKQLSLTTPEDCDDESLKNNIFVKDFKAASQMSSGACTPQLSPHLHGKRFQSETPERPCKSYHSSPSPMNYQNEDEDSAAVHILLGKNSEDPLSRAISQFALVLERYKDKVKLHTSEKISEILASVANGIHSQLRTIESQISAEANKLSSHSKTKRKRLEIKFGEQSERLRVTHDKYKEEVYRLLDEYKTTLEELEAYHLELKGNVDRRNASCRKLLLQAEERIYTQLCDAERTIATIRNGARKKMRSLRTCLNEVF